MKKILPIIIVIVIIIVGGIFLKNRKSSEVVATPTPLPELPVNTIPVSERPFVTLAPDVSGRNLFFTVNGAGTTGEIEYELVYNAAGKQEGVFGRLELANEKQPVEKKLLLGSQSAGGKITYHEGITGGYLTLTTGETKLKEQWNFLRFDPTDPSVSATDGRFSVTLPKTALKKDQVIIVMKPFGLPISLPSGKTLKAGPYAYLTPTAIKGEVLVELKLPAGEYVNPVIMAYDGKAWVALKTKADGETLSASVTSGNVFVAVSE